MMIESNDLFIIIHLLKDFMILTNGKQAIQKHLNIIC